MKRLLVTLLLLGAACGVYLAYPSATEAWETCQQPNGETVLNCLLYNGGLQSLHLMILPLVVASMLWLIGKSAVKRYRTTEVELVPERSQRVAEWKSKSGYQRTLDKHHSDH